MPPLIVPNAWQAVVEGTILGRPFASVFGLLKEGITLTQEITTGLGAGFAAALTEPTSWAPVANDNTTWSTFTLTDVSSAGAPQFVHNLNQTGGSTLDAFPPDAALVITWLTGVRSRSGRGRTYMPGLTEAMVTDGRVNSGGTNALGVFASELMENWDASGHPLGVISRADGLIREVTSRRINDVVDRQVRRRFAQ